MTLEWRGDQVKVKLDAAQKKGINKTMELVVTQAKNNHSWQNRSTALEGSISIIALAAPIGNGFLGKWGSKAIVYALIHELGGRIVPKNADALRFQVNGNWVTTQEVNIPARPYLRPAATVIYPQLASHIREAFGIT